MQRREESDIYYTREKLERMLERLKEMPNGKKGIEFLTHLQASGLSSIPLEKRPTLFMVPDFSNPDREGVQIHSVYICKDCGHVDLYGAWIDRRPIET